MEVTESNRSFMTWSNLLRCGICLGVYRRPHTLTCGHSFCTSCLRNLATLTKEQYPPTVYSRLKFACPACRKKILVSSVLRKRLHINYSIQDFVENWRDQDKKLQDNCFVMVRSIGTQSDESILGVPNEDGVIDLDISMEEESRVPIRFDMASFPKFDSSDESVSGRVHSDEENSDYSDTSSNSELMDNLDRLVIWHPRVQRGPIFVGFLDIARNWFQEVQETILGIFECRSRSVMALIWCGYTFSIMIIANGFFPYMMLYSFLFFVILYAESAQQRRNRPF